MKYRIVTNGEKFRVQYKRMWWSFLWVDVSSYNPHFQCLLIEEFHSKEDAQKFIDARTQKVKWHVVSGESKGE